LSIKDFSNDIPVLLDDKNEKESEESEVETGSGSQSALDKKRSIYGMRRRKEVYRGKSKETGTKERIQDFDS